jgi:hypothetical protein
MADTEDLSDNLSTPVGNFGVNGVKVGETLPGNACWRRRAKAAPIAFKKKKTTKRRRKRRFFLVSSSSSFLRGAKHFLASYSFQFEHSKV